MIEEAESSATFDQPVEVVRTKVLALQSLSA